MSAGIGMTDTAPRSLWARLEHCVARLLPPEQRLLRWSVPAKEEVVATLGSIELRRTRDGLVARTIVKGEQDPASRTALRRLADYTGGYNRECLAVASAKPVVQRPGAPGTWLAQIGLPGRYIASAAPVPRSGKVRIIAQPSEILAVIRLPGRPPEDALTRGEVAIRAAIAGSTWHACGPSVLRLHTPPGLLPWTGGYEVAIAVTSA
jgi:hypothetical protein